MTKAEIKKIQLLDAAQFLEFQQFEDWFGKKEITTQRAAARWVQIREIMELFNVEIDVTLLDFQKAFTIQRRLRQAEIEEAAIQEQLFEDYIN
tara:strand:+ start:705 stop:983 length:279 start_codon:yes stop_codon:yes gene_type:complete